MTPLLSEYNIPSSIVKLMDNFFASGIRLWNVKPQGYNSIPASGLKPTDIGNYKWNNKEL